LVTKIQSELTLFVNDIHGYYADKRAIQTVVEFVSYLKPKRICFNGDIVDFYQLSRFDKDPRRATGVHLQHELDQTKEIIKSFRKAAPRAEFDYTEGNHERRLYKWLCGHQELHGLKALDIRSLLDLDALGVTFYPEEEVLQYHDFVVTHGERVSKHAGMSAKGEFEKWGTNGISGHTHRMGVYSLSNFSGDYVWYENGCLCELSPSYIRGKPNWQHGIAIGDFMPDEERFTIHQLKLDSKYRIFHHGKIIDGIEDVREPNDKSVVFRIGN
jgi:UDP-2,3-diacylglucosamine pyrophosphatase LpxH